MDYRINKIDPEVRQRIQDVTKEGIIHNKLDLETDKDKKKNRNKDNKSFEEELNKFEKTSKIKTQVSAEKIEDIEVIAYKDKENLKDSEVGSIIDIRK